MGYISIQKVISGELSRGSHPQNQDYAWDEIKFSPSEVGDMTIFLCSLIFPTMKVRTLSRGKNMESPYVESTTL